MSIVLSSGKCFENRNVPDEISIATSSGERNSLTSRQSMLCAKQKAEMMSRVADRNAESMSTGLPELPASTSLLHSFSNCRCELLEGM